MTGIQWEGAWGVAQHPVVYRTIHPCPQISERPRPLQKLHGHAKQEHRDQTTPSTMTAMAKTRISPRIP